MKESVAKEWIAALRSGKYKQGQGQLKTQDKFCCLGVLCDISKQSEWFNSYYDENHCTPSPKIVKWAEMKERNPMVLVEGEFWSLAMINDIKKYSFEKIADIIEKNWENL